MLKPKFDATTIKRGLIVGKNLIVKQSPIVLSIAAVGGVVATTVMAVRATIRAKELIEQKKVEEETQIDEELTVEETVKTVWKEYVPVVISAGLTITAIVASSAINEKRKAALAGLYALSESALKEYQEKTEETVGKKKEREIRDKVNASSVQSTPCPFTEDQLGGGKVPIKDLMSGRIFMSTVDHVRQVAAELNEGMIAGEMLASLNDFYEALAVYGLDPIDLGYECGWNVQNLCKPYFTASMTSDMRPILVLDWDRDGRPVSDYRDI